ncbi:hypothetical protein ATJ93_4203 [Halopiger aswanensis]|uniref:Uncharacterized protein n=1 Tax=Halopiger aswanensis TaxID=148449 RepID=A0A3R7DAK2_9EURY|nr:hypothetical protein ATJ93_4203 [Halopiger aswanensis]
MRRKLTENCIECSKENLPAQVVKQKARELAVMYFLRERIDLQIFKKGVTVDRERETDDDTCTIQKANPALERMFSWQVDSYVTSAATCLSMGIRRPGIRTHDRTGFTMME